MEILKLPVISKDDDQDLIDEKRHVLINKFISKTSQVPTDLEAKIQEKTINGITYSEHGKKRITVAFAQSIKLDHDLFGNPQVDINIYYDNILYHHFAKKAINPPYIFCSFCWLFFAFACVRKKQTPFGKIL